MQAKLLQQLTGASLHSGGSRARGVVQQFDDFVAQGWIVSREISERLQREGADDRAAVGKIAAQIR